MNWLEVVDNLLDYVYGCHCTLWRSRARSARDFGAPQRRWTVFRPELDQRRLSLTLLHPAPGRSTITEEALAMSSGPSIVVVGGERVKVCRCGNRFPIEFNSRGQMTSRKLCDRCRSKRHEGLPDTSGIPRCVECTALVGREWGSVTHLDENGRCPACAAWHKRKLARKRLALRSA